MPSGISEKNTSVTISQQNMWQKKRMVRRHDPGDVAEQLN